MKTLSRRKFVETAVMSSVGVTLLSDMALGHGKTGSENYSAGKLSDSSGSGLSDTGTAGSGILQEKVPSGFNTMRPIRRKKLITVTVGQSEGDFQGNDDKILQAAVDYVTNLGGGRVKILPGIYTMRNSLFPKPGITISGSGDRTILLKSPSVSSRIIRESDWFEYCVQVEDPRGFTVGGGLALSRDKKSPEEVKLYTITSIDGNALYLDKRTEENYWMMEEARASTRFSIIYGMNVDDVNIEDIVLDGNKKENEHINDNYSGALFIQYCNRWNIRNVTARNYNSDGFSFQVCDDIHFEDCSSLNNADLGFHPGSGSQRPVFKRCISKGNSQGFFWCWGACDGIAKDCVASENLKYGVNFGHRDTDNILRNCLIEKNGEIGILFRKEVNEYRTGDRNLIDTCVIRDNGKAGPGLGIDIQWKTNDITIRNCRIENSKEGPQRVGIRISKEAQRIALEGNQFSGCRTDIEDQRKTT
jgi:hypothetical protein